MSQTLLRSIVALTGLNLALTGTSFYYNYVGIERNYEEAEARMDELEGTLRGHIGIMEESLERIEGATVTPSKDGGWGKGMGKKAEELYNQRGRNEKKK